MNNFLKFVELLLVTGECQDCEEEWPNSRTSSESQAALHAWRKRHQKKTGHDVKTFTTYVRRYGGSNG